MLGMMRDFVAHNGYANAVMLGAIRLNDTASADLEIRGLLDHVLLAHRFWLLTVLGLPFVTAEELRPAGSFDELVHRYETTHEQQVTWLGKATDTELAGMLESDLIPGGKCSVAQAIVQVCLHSHGHRSQCAKLLRRHNGVPPSMDFITWLVTRLPPAWPAHG